MGEQVNVDANLIAQAAKLTGEENPEKVVEQALQELIRRRSQLQALVDIAGKVQFYEGYDHKELRKSRYDAP